MAQFRFGMDQNVKQAANFPMYFYWIRRFGLIMFFFKAPKLQKRSQDNQVVADSNFKYVLEIKDVPKFKDART